MRNMKGFFPNLFLAWPGVSGQRPAWFIMLLAAMASGGVYAAAGLALMLLAASTEGEGPSPAMAALFSCLLWGASTLWYHLVYLLAYRRAAAEGASGGIERRYSVWGGPLFLLIVFVSKALWLLLKYAAAPLIPFALVIEVRDAPGPGAVAGDALCVALMLYPFILLMDWLH